jgi:hypothetical protein
MIPTTFVLAPSHAGARPTSIVVRIVNTAVNSMTRASIWKTRNDRKPGGAIIKDGSRRISHDAMMRPPAAPRAPRMTLSPASCRARRQRLAPSATRTASS